MNAETNRTLPTETNHEVALVPFDTKDTPYRGFHVRASYLKPPKDRDAWIEIFRDGQPWRSYYYPAYRIYNIAAHFSDMVDGQLEDEEEANREPPDPDGECFRGSEYASALAEQQAQAKRLK
jgi:hypothetical protein